ncbi:MAG: translation initiation factor [Bacteroidales bacterium]|nr:translation initiation factor [Bacteroidales bacterium]
MTTPSNDWMASLEALRSTLPAGTPIENPNDAPASELEKSCAQPVTQGAKKPRLDIIIDRKGRKGKEATIIAGFDPDDNYLEVAAALKKRLGTGGSARGGEILIQGDRRNDVKQYLESQGYKTRLC